MTIQRQRIGFTTIAGISLSLVMTTSLTTDMAIGRSTSPADVGISHSSAVRRQDAVYADGVYTATGYYGSLPSSITVTVTLVDDVITAVEVTPHATNPTSLDLQQRFAAAVPAVVVGKPIDEVNVGRLAGSTGTPEGFNAAIEQIKEQARIGQATPMRGNS